MLAKTDLVWTPVKDSAVQLRWRCLECPRQGCAVPPTFFEESGVPICQNCGADMRYIRTEILKLKRAK